MWDSPCLTRCPLCPSGTMQDRHGSCSLWHICSPRGPEIWHEQLSPGPRAALLIGRLLAEHTNDQWHAGGGRGQVSERGLLRQGRGLFLSWVVGLS